MDIGVYNPQVGVVESGGTETFAREMIKRLSDRHRIVLYTIDSDTPPKVPVPNVVVKGIPAFHRNDQTGIVPRLPIPAATVESASMYWHAKRRGVLKRIEQDVDVLSTFMYLDNLLVSRTVDVPVLHHIWGIPADSWSLRLLLRGSRPDMFLSNSKHTESKLKEYFDIQGDGVVYPGVDVQQFHPDAEPAFTENRPTVMYVGRFVRGKGVAELIDAFADLSVEACLYLIGDGPLRDELERSVAEHGLEDEVEFLGTVPHSEIQHYFTACDVFCLPSYYESFGLVNIEAMACGRPVVTSELEPIEEYVTDGENGLLVPPGDKPALVSALERLIGSPELRRRLGENARDTSAAYSWDEQAERFEDYLRSASGTL